MLPMAVPGTKVRETKAPMAVPGTKVSAWHWVASPAAQSKVPGSQGTERAVAVLPGATQMVLEPGAA
jgi:hypothetical protein